MSRESRCADAGKRLLRWWLQLDRPVPDLGDEELAALVEHNYRWNYGVNLVEGIAWMLVITFLSSSTIVPLFISKLTTSTVPLGLAAMLAQGGWFLPQLLSAHWVERLPRRKPLVLGLSAVLEVLPIWLLLLPAVLAGLWPGLALALFLLIYAWRHLGSGLVAPGWQDLIARVIPTERRGGFWGLTSAIGTVLGLGAAALSARLLATYPFPTSFVFIFGLAAVAIVVGWCALSLTREPAQPVHGPRQSQRQFFANLPDLLRQDVAFRRFLVAQLLLSLGVMGLGFVTVAVVRRWAVPDSTVGIYAGVMLVGQGLGSLVFGTLADRRGHKLSLEWSAGLSALAFALAWLAPDVGWYYLVFLFLGVGLGIRLISGSLVVMEFSEPRRRPTYIGVANTLTGIASMVGPLLAAWLAGVDFGLLFALGVVINLAALATLHWWVREPRGALRSATN